MLTADVLPRNVSAADPKVRSTYRVDQGLDPLRSQPNAVDRTKSVSFEASGGSLAGLFDGTRLSLYGHLWPIAIEDVLIAARAGDDGRSVLNAECARFATLSRERLRLQVSLHHSAHAQGPVSPSTSSPWICIMPSRDRGA